MERILKIFKTFLFVVATTLAAHSLYANEEPPVEKRKVITRSYPVAIADKISLSNKFGEMKLITWDKKEIQITVTIIAKAMTVNRAEELLSGIVIESTKNNDGVTCFTQFKNSTDARHGAVQDEEYTINYEVYLPDSNPLSVQNKFGLLVVPDYKGEAEIKSEHGTLKTGRISNAKEVWLEFGRGEIFHINNGHITIRYSQVEINKLSGDLSATFEFADSIRISMDNDIRSMSIQNIYSTLYLDLAGSFSGKFKITSQLNGVITKSTLKMEEELVNPQAGETDKNSINHRYTVTAGTGERIINIDSKFGKVILGQYYVYKKSTTTTTTTKELRKTEKSTKQSN